MASTYTAVRAPTVGDGAQARRRLMPRRPLPGARAVVGGLLVAIAGLGTFAAWTTAGQRPATRYVVAARTLRIGAHIRPGDLATQPMSLPRPLAGGLVFRDPSALVGTVVVAPLEAGELVQAGDVVQSSPRGAGREISFAIDASRAVGGALQPGDTVDVVATYGSGDGASTAEVARDVTVVASTPESSTLGSSGGATEVVTLAVPSSQAAVAIAQAVDAGQVVLVRTTGAG